jgi:3',5'-nucleoside bisphosphate phosphatase
VSHPTPPRIDLHLHTTASDGRSTPAGLVSIASRVGLTVMAVTDHDTVAAVREVQAEGAGAGIEVVPGIEVTAVENGHDVHMLGYFLHPDDAALAGFLARQRETRVTRIEAIGRRLAELGLPVDVAALLAEAGAGGGRSIGRPQVARAMMAAGHVAGVREAFDRWLGRDRPAFVPRTGASPEEVIHILHRAGALVSLAHPGRTRIDGRIPALRDAGLDALEVYHSDHDERLVARYAAMASDLGLLRTGGSDFHGDPVYGVEPGGATLPPREWERLLEARDRHVVR